VQLSEHFSLAEFTVTNTGKPNQPTNDYLPNLLAIAETMEEVREALGYPIRISSGYRSELVNKLVKGSPTSAHLKGLACDFVCPGFGTPKQVALAIIDAGIAKDVDQLILEYKTTKSNGGDWVHIGLAEVNRGHVLTKSPGKGYLPGILNP